MKSPSIPNRRQFLKSTTGILALAAMDLSNLSCTGLYQPLPQPRAPRGPNERINMAIIGLGGRSGGHLGAYNSANNCQITHVCDPDTAKAQQAIERARTSNGGTDPQFVQDIRRVMDDRSIDAVSIATCNHWHALAAIWAMQAGKDVYVEKPMSHNFNEGRRVVQVAERTKMVCQAGTQMRSNPALMESMAFIHSGALGKIKVSRALCYKARPTIGKVDGPQQPPSTVDYNLWCGPAPLAPITRTKFHYDWHWLWDFGNGDLGNQGVHELDVARWAMGVNTMPHSVMSVGGRLGYVDDGQTANTQVVEFDYGSDQPKLIAEVRGLNTAAYRSRGVENVVECENGYLVSPTYTTAIAYDRDGNVIRNFEGGADANHYNNFINVVRSRRMQDLHCPAIEGHLSSALVHLANNSHRLGTQVPLDSRSSDLFADPVAKEAAERMVKHLADNKVPLTGTTFCLGRRLNLDAKSETCINDREANRMLTREYRYPFVVPSRA